jgi:hypothetical protein
MRGRFTAIVLAAPLLIVLVLAGRAALGGRSVADLESLPAARADARVDGTLTDTDRADLTRAVERSVEHVEELFEHRFVARPKLVIFGNTALFNAGLAELFDYSEGNATLAGSNYGGIYDHTTSTIAVNLQTVGPDARAETLEHELTHYMVRELTASQHLPAWFEEGIAMIAQRHAGSAGRWPEEEALIGRALATSERISLPRLETLQNWHETYPRFGQALYLFAENAASQVRARIGWRGVLDLLGTVADGRSFADAYRAASGETVGDVDVRLRQDRAPQLISRALPGGGAQWTLFTGKPLTEEKVTIGATAAAYHVSFTVSTDDLGLYRGTFGSTAPPGVYVVTAAGARVEISTTRR